MEVITIPVSEMYGKDSVLRDWGYVPYRYAENYLQEASRDIPNVWGYLNGKAVVVTYEK